MPADLDRYRAKRNFDRTPEPAGDERPGTSAGLQFVVQKHAARRLHYDFRLEHEGVLKSWAVPKGPSLDPRERRLAVQTEDHPIEYATFEGVIPEGEYGGGAVLVWDRGYWVPNGDPTRGLAKGKLDFTLHGEKLRGSWALVRLAPRAGRRDDKNNWLLIKHRDSAARIEGAPEIVDQRPESVLTGRGLDEVAAERDRVWHSKGEGETAPPPTAQVGRPDTVPGAVRRAMPRALQLQHAEPADATPNGPGWLHEPKLDGLRLLCRVDRGKVSLRDAAGADRTAALSNLGSALAGLGRPALLDGMAVVFDEQGRSAPDRIEKALKGRDARDAIVLIAFDLLYLDGWDLRGAALRARKELLRLLLAEAPLNLRYGDHIEGHGADFYREACRLELHGVVSKRADAKYRGGSGHGWRVVPCRKHAKPHGAKRSKSSQTIP